MTNSTSTPALPSSPSRVALACLLLLGAACGGADLRLEPRFVAVHNALTAMGLAQTGAISQGSLPEGAAMDVTASLDAGQCYTYVVLGSAQAQDLDLTILDDTGTEVARDGSHDAHAAAQLCPTQAGVYRVVVRMTAGQGAYTLASWSDGGGAAERPVVHVAAGGRCGDATPIALGQTVQGTTADGARELSGSCASGGAPEQVYRLEVRERQQISAVVQSSYDAALYLLRGCRPGSEELACNDDSPQGTTTRSEISVMLDPGTYYLVVDGFSDASGEYSLVVNAAAVVPVAQLCAAAQPLAPGQTVSGSTAGGLDGFRASCAGGAASPEQVFYLDVPQRSRLRARLQTDHDGALHIRRTCEAATSELACNDDHVDQRNALVTALVDPGRYYVFADGYGAAEAGNFTLTADLAPEQGGSAAGETCAAPATARPGQAMEVDLFEARDDFVGSCGGASGADVVYRVDVQGQSRLHVSVARPDFAGVMYVRRACSDPGAEVACAAFAAGAGGTLEATLSRGTYFVVFDGQGDGAFGGLQATLRVDDLAALERDCRAAPLLRLGQTVTGSTAGGTNRFEASCAGNARSSDQVYRLQVRQRATVRLRLSADFDGALHVRRSCAEAATEIACNDDHEGNRISYLETTLDPGTYYVIVDGFGTDAQGTYTLTWN